MTFIILFICFIVYITGCHAYIGLNPLVKVRRNVVMNTNPLTSNNALYCKSNNIDMNTIPEGIIRQVPLNDMVLV